jgi:competence protein ComEC
MWRIGIAFLIGHCCVHVLPAQPSGWPYLLGLLAAFVAAGTLRSVLLAAVLCGFGWAWYHAHDRLADDLAAHLEGRDIIVTGDVASVLHTRDLDPQFDFDVAVSDHDVPRRIRLTWYDAEVRPSAGERWQFVVRLKRRNGFANPGGFDYEGYLFRAGIGASGYIRADDRNRRLAPAQGYRVLRARAWLAERIASAVGPSQMLGILQGLAVGDTQAMTPEQWQVFAATGMSHLMAISGLHISMLAALAALAGGMIVYLPWAQRWRITAIHGQAIAGLGAALGYSLLAGMSIPTQRTLVMLCVYFVAKWMRRTIDVGNTLGWALIAVLLIDPFAPMAPGAWLSFGAVAIIIATMAGRLQRDTKIAGFARVQWGVTIGLVPILTIAFGSVSLVSPLANAIAIPLFTVVVVPLILLGTAMACVSLEFGGAVLGASVWILEQSWPLFAWLAELPLALWYWPALPAWHFFLLALGTCLLVLPGAFPLRVAALVLCLPALLYRPAAPNDGEFELAVLDVGQGLAAVVVTRSHVLVYDTGPGFRSGRDTGELVVVPYLRSRGVHRLDRLIVSHGDFDHRGGMESILQRMPTASLVIGDSVDTTRSAEPCVAGMRWRWDEVEFEIVHPADDYIPRNKNDGSCVLRVSGQGGSALLTGDIESHAEAHMLLNGGAAQADIVTVAHHGSRSSSSDAFVAATGASLAIVSAGYRNRWNFPKPDVVERWQASGAKLVSTIPSGAIEIAVPSNGVLEVRHHRETRRRYWSSR